MKRSYLFKRHIVFTIITAFALILPFININGNQFFLLSFDKSELHLFFVKFSVSELYLMPFLLIILFLFIFFITTLGGRIWCGWTCPQTIFRTFYRDFIQTKILKIYKNSNNRQLPPQNNAKRALGVIIWVLLSFIIASNFLWYFVPPADFFNYLSAPSEHKILLCFIVFIALWLTFDICFLAENFCVYLCPYARVQSVMFDNDTIQVIYNQNRGGVIYDGHNKLYKKPIEPNAQCTGCEACVKICPTHIDIRMGMQLECINCLECADACAKTMANFNLPSLIEWTSKNAQKDSKKVKLFRFRTCAYIVALSVVFIALCLMSTKKESMLLNINRTGELYHVAKDKSVENSYIFLFQNTDKIEHAYYFDINETAINIKRPSEPIKLKSGEKRRVVVTLSSPNLNLGKRAIKINAYAIDDKERVNVVRESIFVDIKK